MSKSKQNRRLLLVTAIPLLAGFVIYFSCRPSTLAYYSWIPFKGTIDLNSIHFSAYEKCLSFVDNSFIGNIAIYSMPAALYAFSLAYYLKKRYLQKKFKRQSYFKRFYKYSFFAVIISFLPEVLQLLGLVPGHYDLADVLTALAASAIAFIL